MKGFTFIETIITIFVFTLAMGAVMAFIIMGYRTQSYAFGQARAIQEARRGIEVMVKEIREARTGEDGSYVIYNAQDNEFSFFSDIDRDLAIEKVRYFSDGTNFKKGIIEPTVTDGIADYSGEEEISILSQYVRNAPSVFRYFDANGEELFNPDRRKNVKLMEVSLVINIDPNRAPNDFELKSDVYIRNLGTAL